MSQSGITPEMYLWGNSLLFFYGKEDYLIVLENDSFVFSMFLLHLRQNYGVIVLLPQAISKRESGVNPELYP